MEAPVAERRPAPASGMVKDAASVTVPDNAVGVSGMVAAELLSRIWRDRELAPTLFLLVGGLVPLIDDVRLKRRIALGVELDGGLITIGGSMIAVWHKFVNVFQTQVSSQTQSQTATTPT